jgi:hypothetical protein
MACLPFPREESFPPADFLIRPHHTPSEKQSPEVAFGNTAFLLATPRYLFGFIVYYF